MPEPLEPIEIHTYYAASWVVNHHGLNQLRALADIADEMNIDLRVRQMFTDQYGYMIYPFAVKVDEEATLRELIKQVAAGMGMEEWYIVNVAYFEKAVPFGNNLRKVLAEMPLWEQQMRAYADHNAALYEKQSNPEAE